MLDFGIKHKVNCKLCSMAFFLKGKDAMMSKFFNQISEKEDFIKLNSFEVYVTC